MKTYQPGQVALNNRSRFARAVSCVFSRIWSYGKAGMASFAVQSLLLNQIGIAQTVPIEGSAASPSASFQQRPGTASAHVHPTPSAAPHTVPSAIMDSLAGAITNTNTIVVDFANLPNHTLSFGSSNYANYGTIYAVSSDPTVTTAILRAGSFFNALNALSVRLRLLLRLGNPASPPSGKTVVINAIS